MLPNLNAEIRASIHWRKENNLAIPSELLTRAIKAAGDLTAINAEYHDAITQALLNYLEGGSMQSAKGLFKRGTSNAFNDAFDLGWIDGEQEMPVDDNANEWLGAQMTAEFGFVDTVFQSAKELKKEEGFNALEWASARADGYTGTIEAIYNAGKLFASKNQMLTWHLGQTEKHCDTCAKLDGGSHRASWYVARNYIPRKPGAAMKCGGYYCDCSLTNKKGEDVTI